MLTMFQQGLKRRATRQFLDDPGLIQLLAAPIDVQTNAIMKAATLEQVTTAMSGDVSALASALATGLSSQGIDPVTLNSSVGTGFLQQLLTMLMTLLTGWIPAATP